MSRHFDTMEEMGLHLLERAVASAVSLHNGLERVGRKVERTAKSEFGHYQREVEHFPAWPELAESTKDERLRQGYTENDPLLRSGELRDSITHKTDGLEVTIGSTDDRMPYQEFGTKTIPPRPVLGPAAFRNKKAIQRILGAAAMEGVIGGEMIHEALGYAFETGKE
jgi:phage protein, HK97 gp10 family